MVPSSLSVADSERMALADLLAELGPAAPTCCDGWTTAHLAAHLVVRGHRPDALPGYAVEQLGVARPLTAWSHRSEDRLRESVPFAEVVGRPVGTCAMVTLGVAGCLANCQHHRVRHPPRGRAPRAAGLGGA